MTFEMFGVLLFRVLIFRVLLSMYLPLWGLIISSEAVVMTTGVRSRIVCKRE